MRLAELFPVERVFDLRAPDKRAVLAELARRAAGVVDYAVPDLAAAVAAREALGSTGVGSGIAVPHARLRGTGSVAAFFARLDRPVDWAAIDARPVDLVCLLLSPKDAGPAHLAALAAVTRRLRDPEVARAIRAAGDAAASREALVG